MQGRDQQVNDDICREAIQLLQRINYARHGDGSNIIKMMVDALAQYNEASALHNVKLIFENMRHLMGFELDPGFTAQEKLVLSTLLQKLELRFIESQLEKNSNSLFANDSSSLYIDAELLKQALQDTDKVEKAWGDVSARLFQEEQKRNEEINKALEISKAKPAINQAKSAMIAEMKASVAAGNKVLKAKELARQSMFKRKPTVSPRSIDESISKDMKRKRK